MKYMMIIILGITFFVHGSDHKSIERSDAGLRDGFLCIPSGPTDTGSEIDSRLVEGNSELQAAIVKGNQEEALQLIEARASLTHTNRDGWTALGLAAYFNQPPVATAILHAEYLLNHPTTSGKVFHVTEQMGRWWQRRNIGTAQAMIAAFRKKHKNVLRELVKHELSMPMTGLLYAVGQGYVPPALPSLKKDFPLINGAPCLLRAAIMEGRDQEALSLIRQRASLTTWDNYSHTPLYYAALYEHENLIDEICAQNSFAASASQLVQGNIRDGMMRLWLNASRTITSRDIGIDDTLTNLVAYNKGAMLQAMKKYVSTVKASVLFDVLLKESSDTKTETV